MPAYRAEHLRARGDEDDGEVNYWEARANVVRLIAEAQRHQEEDPFDRSCETFTAWRALHRALDEFMAARDQ
jgi:hypothetical protein